MPTTSSVQWAVAVFSWVAFLVLMIAGERLELSRVLRPTRIARNTFVAAVGLIVAGLLLSLVAFEAGLRVSGAGLRALKQVRAGEIE